MNKVDFIKKQESILEDALLRLKNNELQPNEYLGLSAPLYTTYGDFLENVILSQPNWLDGLMDVDYECSTEMGCDFFTHKAHFYQYVIDGCEIHLTVQERDDAYVFHYVLKGEEAIREKYFAEIETMIDQIFGIIHDY